MPDLLEYVQAELAARKSQWRQIADSVPKVSYSWVYQVGSGKYESTPNYGRLQAVAEYLRSTPRSESEVSQ